MLNGHCSLLIVQDIHFVFWHLYFAVVAIFVLAMAFLIYVWIYYHRFSSTAGAQKIGRTNYHPSIKKEKERERKLALKIEKKYCNNNNKNEKHVLVKSVLHIKRHISEKRTHKWIWWLSPTVMSKGKTLQILSTVIYFNCIT